LQLAPGPALVFGIDRHGLAHEGFRIERRVGPRLAAQRRRSDGDPLRGAGAVVGGFDAPAQALVGEVGPRRRQAPIELQGGDPVHRGSLAPIRRQEPSFAAERSYNLH
jgi:hypothetical protein